MLEESIMMNFLPIMKIKNELMNKNEKSGNRKFILLLIGDKRKEQNIQKILTTFPKR